MTYLLAKLVIVGTLVVTILLWSSVLVDFIARLF